MSEAALRKIGVLGAMPIELKPFVRALHLQREPWADGRSVWRGRTDTAEVTATITGIGTAGARAVTEGLLDSFPVEQLFMIGVAGGLDPKLGIGDLVVPEIVLDGDRDREYRPTTPAGYEASGTLHTSDQMVLDAEPQARLLARGVVALDMETAVVGEVCEARGCPWSVFRAISDTVADGIVGETTLGLTNPDGSANLAAVSRLVARHPTALRDLVKLGRDTNRATAAIAQAAAGECRRA